MSRQDQMTLLEGWRMELETVERLMQDTTLPHSDQQMLDQAWEYYAERVERMEDLLDLADDMESVEWRDAAEYLDEEEDDSPPPPPSVTCTTLFRADGTLVVRPPPISIPEPSGPSEVPPAPRAVRGVDERRPESPALLMPSEEEMEEMSRAYDADQGCRYCSGCYYCEESSAYDPMGEI